MKWKLAVAALAVAATALWLFRRSPPPPAPANRVNVVLISLDSVRADHLRAYGYARETSPNIDALAARSVLFENAVAETSWTLPSHVSLFTGLTTNIHQVSYDGMRLDERRVTLAETLQKQGYRTKGFYSAPYLHPFWGLGQGFAEGDYVSCMGLRALFDEPQFDGRGFRDPEFVKAWEAFDDKANRTVTSPLVADAAVRFLEEHGRGPEPFFLFLHFFDPHYDYQPPESHWRPFDRDYDPSRAGAVDPSNFFFNPKVNRSMDPRELQHVLALYDGEIHFTDEHVGRVLETLGRLGLTDDTLVVLVSDHGDEFFEHGRKGHRFTLYDEVLRVPLMFALPGRLPAGKRVKQQARHIDVMPTILALAGIAPEEEMAGANLLPFLQSAPPSAHDPAFSRLVWPDPALQHYWTAVRTPEWKYVHVRTQSVELQQRLKLPETLDLYFDLQNDPGERRPLAGAEVRPRLDEARRLLQAFEGWEQTRRGAMAWSEGGRTELPPAVVEQLRSLGYVQ